MMAVNLLLPAAELHFSVANASSATGDAGFLGVITGGVGELVCIEMLQARTRWIKIAGGLLQLAVLGIPLAVNALAKNAQLDIQTANMVNTLVSTHYLGLAVGAGFDALGHRFNFL